MFQTLRGLLVLLLSATTCGIATAETKPALRVLRDECLGCHKPGKAKGGLLLHSHEKMLAGGDSGDVVIPGKADDSLMYQVLLADGDPHMPPKKQLSDSQRAAIKQWIDSGAAWDATVFDEAPAPQQVALAAMPANYQPVLAIALSPNDTQLAVAKANVVIVRDLTKPGQPPVGQLEGQIEPVQSLIWTPDGKQLITGGYQRVTIWDLASKKPVRTITAPLLGNITALAIDAGGKTLFVADGATGGAGFLHTFDPGTGRHVATWKAHEDTVYALRISPQEGRLLSGSADKLVKLWDTTTRKLVTAYEGHTNHVLAVAFNKDGSQIASTGADREIKIWDVKSGEQIISLGNRKTVFTSLAWTADGKALAVTTDKGTGSVYTDFKVHDGTQRSTGAKERVLTPVKEMLTCISITTDGKSVYAGGFDGNLHAWDGTTGKPVAGLPSK